MLMTHDYISEVSVIDWEYMVYGIEIYSVFVHDLKLLAIYNSAINCPWGLSDSLVKIGKM